MPPAAGDSIAGYRLLRCIGQGASSTVFLALAPGSGASAIAGPGAGAAPAANRVALKLMPLLPLDGAADRAAARAVFLRSAELARRLVHPGIVALHDAGVSDASDVPGGLAWLAMEAVPGSDLVRYTRAARLLPEALVLRIGARIARALAHAHRLGVVHRDVKPANVLVDWPSDTVKLTDFGLARSDDSARTATGIVPGSPAYMAPELLAGALPTPHSDLYALGATLFQLLTGQLPHDGASMGELLRRVAHDPAPDPCRLRPALPPPLGLLIARLLATRAADRPADADAAARLLTEVAQSFPLPACGMGPTG